MEAPIRKPMSLPDCLEGQSRKELRYEFDGSEPIMIDDRLSEFNECSVFPVRNDSPELP